MLQAREDARKARNWPEADRLRNEIASHGWQVLDTPDGSRLEPAA
jgi:cysteinyl-tRNA synthetase